MSDEFDRDLREVLDDSGRVHQELLRIVRSLRESDLDVAKRGEWTVRVTLAHVSGSEHYYAERVRNLREQKAPRRSPAAVPASIADAVSQLEAANNGLLQAVQGVDEDTFYRLKNVGYAIFGGGDDPSATHSVASVLRDATLHKKEHVQQIMSTLARR